MELKTKSVFRVSDHLTKDRPCWQLAQGPVGKHSLKRARTFFLHSVSSLRQFSNLPNFLQKSIYPNRFHFAFHSFVCQLMDGRNRISFFQLLIGSLTSINFEPEGFSSTRSIDSFNLYMNDRYTFTGRY